MKVSRTIYDWEAMKWSKKDMRDWIDEQLSPIKRKLCTKEESLLIDSVEGFKRLKQPKRCKITMTYEIKD